MSRTCPHCRQQTPENAACTHCGAVAAPTSLAGLLSTPASDEADDTATQSADRVGDAGSAALSNEADMAEVGTTTDDADASVGIDVTPAESPAATDDEPLFTRNTRALPTPSPALKWQWAAMVVLIALLGLQILLADRERLATDSAWRPLLGTLCGALGCALPPWREPQAFAMLSRDVRPLPDAPGTLLVQATFRNDARWPQPWPTLQVSLSDADGRVVGARAFTASEYLDTAETQAELAPGQSAQVSMRLREPHEGVVAFSFDFH